MVYKLSHFYLKLRPIDTDVTLVLFYLKSYHCVQLHKRK